MTKLTNVFLSTLLFSSILACGGGGGGGGGNPQPPVNQNPTATAPADFSAVENTNVSLDGTASRDSDGSISSYAWSQTAGSPTVTLNNANAATADFTAPDVTMNTDLTFTLTVTDNDGATATDTVIVTIQDDQPPVAVAPADFQAVEQTTVQLDGAGSSDDVQITSYLWEQTAGDVVTLSNATSQTASFTSPEVTSQPIDLTFQLTVTDSQNATSTDTVTVTVIDTPPAVNLSGKITYDHVPHNTTTDGLNYDATVQSDIRGATVELLDSTATTILDTVSSDANGNYSFEVTPSTSYVVRVKAEMLKNTGVPTWNFTVVDNTNNKAIYTMESSVQAVGVSSMVLNLNASSGWGGASYTSTRVAAPFAILDSVYEAKEKVIAADPSVLMPALMLNWSTANVAASGDKALGQIGTSHFDGSEIYILGDEDSDTDEYDGHVIVHEWGHYFEGQLSRSDSIGGSHGQGDKLDPRVSLGEGWGNALSGIVTDDPFYRDSAGSRQSSGFDINVESNPSTNNGWFSESSVQSLIYDLYDSNNDGADTISLGFTPIYELMVGAESTTEAYTTIFSFANQLKISRPSDVSTINALLASQNIDVQDDFGTGESNDGGDTRNLPLYQTLPIGGSVQICSYGTNGQYNKLGNRKYLMFDIAMAGSYSFTANGTSAGDDPDIYVYKQGVFQFKSEANGNESTTQNLSIGKYVMEAYEYSNIQGTVKDTCIDLGLTAN